ncbi:hypothetical protein GDO78_001376 [Eleutherodactylus coqui]|uniref:Uncharacterized protein n=1 Tax=Eleutherodactylus coqui TaxID=57060 RepID=A0A8J6KHR0_ELECQ|nr:hypothetical protein GDO78_001376 [Eleutherodactylus coqui]
MQKRHTGRAREGRGEGRGGVASAFLPPAFLLEDKAAPQFQQPTPVTSPAHGKGMRTSAPNIGGLTLAGHMRIYTTRMCHLSF